MSGTTNYNMTNSNETVRSTVGIRSNNSLRQRSLQIRDVSYGLAGPKQNIEMTPRESATP